MKIVTDSNGNQYIDKALSDYISQIWSNYDNVVENDKNIMFCKNVTINKLITDYCDKGIKRVIKSEKADYLIINRMEISNFPQYFDGTNITDDDSQEVVYGVYNNNESERLTIATILDFYEREHEVIYVNQNKLNESLNNGVIITEENYLSFKELANSDSDSNHKMVVNMVLSSDLKSNWEWIALIFHENYTLFRRYDEKNIVEIYVESLRMGHTLRDLLSSKPSFFKAVTNKVIKDKMVDECRQIFKIRQSSIMEELFGDVDGLTMQDFKINYIED